MLLVRVFILVVALLQLLDQMRALSTSVRLVQRQQKLVVLQSRFFATTKKQSPSKLQQSTTEDEEISEVGTAMPTKFGSDFMQTMLDRGFIHQCTDFKGLDDSFANETVSAYLGFDATAKSLHVGSLLQIMILRNLQRAGHKPIILVGGGTTKVGDPSGKDESRKLLTEDTINENIDSLTKVFEKFITFGDGPTDAVLVNNAGTANLLLYLS
jgi:hypothetical protein